VRERRGAARRGAARRSLSSLLATRARSSPRVCPRARWAQTLVEGTPRRTAPRFARARRWTSTAVPLS